MTKPFKPSDAFIAANAHWEFSAVIVFALYIFVHVHHIAFFGVLGLLVYAAVKEFIFDKYVEQQPFKDNLIDFIWYAIGALGAHLSLLLTHKVLN